MANIRCCKGCIPPKRYPGCHEVCEEYLADKAKWEKEKEKIKEQKESAAITIAYIISKRRKSRY